MAKVKLHNVQVSFPDFFEAKAFKEEDKKYYGGAFILEPKKHAKEIAEMKAAIIDAAVAKWGEKAEKILAAIPAEKRCFRDGNTHRDKNGDIYTGFEGNLYVSARRAEKKPRPLIIGRDKGPITEADGLIHSGCVVNAVVDVWAQDNAWGRRINADFCGAQFVELGESFGGGAPASTDDFDDLEGSNNDLV